MIREVILMEHLEQPVVGAAAPYPQAYVISIRTGRGGRWEYSPWFQAPALHVEARVALTGRRTPEAVGNIPTIIGCPIRRLTRRLASCRNWRSGRRS